MPDNVPGVVSNGVSADIFHEPTGLAWEAVRLVLGNWLELLFTESAQGNGSATVITHMAGYMNFLAYILITIIMGYVVVAAIIRTASEGKVMGGSWSTVWLPLRTALACFLLVPIGVGQASSISFIQASIAWVGMIGSNAADNLANFAVSNISKRAVTIGGDANSYQLASNMVKAGFCYYSIYHNVGEERLPAKIGENLTGSSPVMYGYNAMTLENAVNSSNNSTDNSSNNSNQVGGAPGNQLNVDQRNRLANSTSDSHLSPLSDTDWNTSIPVYLGPSQGACASYKVSDTSDEQLASDILGEVLKVQQEVYVDVVLPLVDNRYADYEEALLTGDEISEKLRDSAKKLNTIINEYNGKITNIVAGSLNASMEEYFSDGNSPVRIEQSKVSERKNSINVFINPTYFSDKGWGHFGLYYTLLSSSIGDVQSKFGILEDVANFNSPNGCEFTDSDYGFFDGVADMFGIGEESTCEYVYDYKTESLVISHYKDVIQTDGEPSKASVFSSICSSLTSCEINSIESAAARYIAEPILEMQEIFSPTEGVNAGLSRAYVTAFGMLGSDEILGIEEKGDRLTPGALYISDPIVFTSNLGHAIVYSANVIKAGLRVMEGVASGAQSSSVPLVSMVTGGIGGFLGAIVEYITGVLKFILPAGMAMAYFIPIVPALIWATAFISWLLMYIESIVNSPMTVTLMATPEGEGISGSRLERKIAMIFAVFLKPSLLVIGVVLSMMILNVGFVIFNQIFWLANASASWSYDIFAVGAVVIIWFTVILIFMHEIFKIIVTFADDSLEYFMGRAAKQFGNNIDNVQSEKFSSTSLATGSGAGALLGGIAKPYANNKKKKKEEKENNKE